MVIEDSNETSIIRKTLVGISGCCHHKLHIYFVNIQLIMRTAGDSNLGPSDNECLIIWRLNQHGHNWMSVTGLLLFSYLTNFRTEIIYYGGCVNIYVKFRLSDYGTQKVLESDSGTQKVLESYCRILLHTEKVLRICHKGLLLNQLKQNQLKI